MTRPQGGYAGNFKQQKAGEKLQFGNSTTGSDGKPKKPEGEDRCMIRMMGVAVTYQPGGVAALRNL